MATVDKDLEELKKEHKDLSDQLRRGAILSLTVLSVFVISFSRACDKAKGSEARNTVCQIKKLSETSSQDPNTSYIFEQFDFSDATCDEPCPAPSPTVASSSGPPVSSASPTTGQTPEAPAATTSSTAQARPTPTEAERKRATDCQTKLEAALEASAEKWFGVEPPIPGVKVNIDLRYWVFLLPPLFFLCGVYLHTLRTKLRVVEALGAHKLSTVTTEDTPVLHRLSFDKQSSYKRFPSGLAGMLFVIVYLFLPIYLAAAGFSFWAYLATESILWIGFLFAILTFYAVAYCHFVTNRLNNEIARVTDQPAPPNFIRTVRRRVKGVIQRLAQRLNPRFPLSAGSVLLFMTLALTIGQSGCAEKRYSGYDVLVGAEGAHWYTAHDVLGDVVPFEAVEGRVLYASVLFLALISAVLVVLPSFYRQLSNKHIRELLLILSGGILVLSVMDFSSDFVFIAPWDGRPGLFLWLILMVVWIRYSFSKQTNRREKWKRIRAPLVIFSVPFFVMAWWYAFERLMLPGLIVYIIGVHLLFLGLVHIQYRHTALPDEPDPTPRFKGLN